MVNVSSLPDVGGSVFELDTQAGITQLLLSVRASELPADVKHEIRDVVFQYTNGGRDATVKRALEQKILMTGLKPVLKKNHTATTLPPPPLIGTFRSTPVFTAPKFVPVTETAAKAPVSIPVVSKSPAEPTPRTERAPEEPIAVDIPEPITTVPVVEPEPVPEVVSVVPPKPQPVSVPVPIQSLDDNQAYLNRIREIKAVVNERVGNPVHLVDIDNAVGREYMSALLEAMKKLNSGSSPVQAMQRLEAAFTAVEVTLDAHDAKGNSGSEESSLPEEFMPVPSPVSVPLSVKPVVPSYEPVPPVMPEPQPILSEPVSDWIPPVVRPPEPVQPVAPAPSNPSVSTTAPAVVSGWNAVPTTPIASPLVHSLAEAPAPKTPEVLPTTKKVEDVSVTGDVLYTEEVNEGLEQLLMEWSIFKKSGLFGTGPKGREHPLFKKVSTLQIPLLLAGRFEGATQEIKQSITDYMNGWRYEQGIIYEPGEQFEHYLRRVIRHILDLQNHRIH